MRRISKKQRLWIGLAALAGGLLVYRTVKQAATLSPGTPSTGDASQSGGFSSPGTGLVGPSTGSPGSFGGVEPAAAFAAVFLDEPSREALLAWWRSQVGELYSRIDAARMVIAYRPSQALVDALPVGQNVELGVVGWAEGERAQIVVVRAPLIRDGVGYLTVATPDGGASTQGAAVLERGYTTVAGPRLVGRLGLGEGDEVVFTTGGDTQPSLPAPAPAEEIRG